MNDFTHNISRTPGRRTGGLILNAFVMDYGHHESAWRAARAKPSDSVSLDHYADIAARAEAAAFDAIFFADIPAVTGSVEKRAADALDPILLLAAIAARTERIGLIATASTTYSEPFTLARAFATLDHISNGRAGWNMVTTSSPAAAGNFGAAEFPAPEDRYRRGREFLDVANALWDSWGEDAIVGDHSGGVFADADKVRPIDHAGDHFAVSGPLNVRRSPQGRPVQVQAGSSDPGIDIAGEYADAVFTAQREVGGGLEFAERVRAAAQRHGRAPDSVKILPGIVPVIRDSEAEALRAVDDLDDLIVTRHAVASLASVIGVDPELIDLDRPLPWDVIGDPAKFRGKVSRADLILTLAHEGNLTARQVIRRLGGGRGHNIVAGTAEQVADYVTDWYRIGAADGFNVMPPVYDTEFQPFIDGVLPILRERGLFRTAYSGATLRDHYGLARPPARFDRDATADQNTDDHKEAAA